MSLAANPDIMYRLLIQSVVDYAIYLLTPEGIVANWNPGASAPRATLPMKSSASITRCSTPMPSVQPGGQR